MAISFTGNCNQSVNFEEYNLMGKEWWSKVSNMCVWKVGVPMIDEFKLIGLSLSKVSSPKPLGPFH